MIYLNQSFRIHTLSIKLIEAISHYCPPAPAHGAPCGYAPPADTSLSQLKAHHAYNTYAFFEIILTFKNNISFSLSLSL